MKKNRIFFFIKGDFHMKINRKEARAANPNKKLPFCLYLPINLQLAYPTISWAMELEML